MNDDIEDIRLDLTLRRIHLQLLFQLHDIFHLSLILRLERRHQLPVFLQRIAQLKVPLGIQLVKPDVIEFFRLFLPLGLETLHGSLHFAAPVLLVLHLLVNLVKCAYVLAEKLVEALEALVFEGDCLVFVHVEGLFVAVVGCFVSVLEGIVDFLEFREVKDGSKLLIISILLECS